MSRRRDPGAFAPLHRREDGTLTASARALRLGGLFVGLIVLFVLLLTVTFAIPAGPVAKHVRASVPILEAEGVYPRPFIDHAAFQLDNTTDSLMLDIALGEPSLGPFLSSMAMYYGVAQAGDGAFDPIQVLRTSASGQRMYREAYARYWHGYQVILRPALCFFNISDLRYMNMLMLGTLLLVLLALMWTRAGPEAPVAFAASMLLGGFAVVPMSLQYSGMTYVAILGILAVMIFAKAGTTSRGDLELFLVLGATAAFVDLLTKPLLALGWPIGIALVLRLQTDPNGGAKQDLIFLGRAAGAWFAGYAGAWVSKWALANLLVGTEVARSALQHARLWTGDGSAASISVEALKVNVMNMLPWLRFDPELTGLTRYVVVGPVGLVLVAALVAGLVLLARYRKPKAMVKRAAVMLALVPLPYLWLWLLGPHSKLHHAYTYRVQAIAVFAIVYFVAASVDWNRVKQRLAQRGLVARGG